MRSVLLLLPLCLLTTKAEKLSSLVHSTTVTLKWNTDLPSQSVLFSVTLSDLRLEWIGIGFSDHGKFNHSDICVWRGDVMRDYYITGSYLLEQDRAQDCELVRRTRRGFVFRRRFNTCDPKDYAFEPGTTQFIFAGAYEWQPNFSSDSVHKSLHYGQLLDSSPPLPPLESDRKEFSVLADKALIPSEVTNYWCIIKQIPHTVTMDKHHIIKMHAVVQEGNEHLVHHMEVFQCQSDDQEEYSGNCNDATKPRQSSRCSHVIAAWSMGEGPVYYPSEAGFPMGGPSGRRFVMVEIHYNNERKLAGVEDNSGFQFVVTPSLRQFDAGIMELGLIYSDANSIPPSQDTFAMTGYCVADCTQKLPSQGIRIFASQLHAHLTGRKLWTSHYRNGVKLGELNRDDHYSPHWQHVQQIRPYVEVKQGDVLATTCVYETRNRAYMTLGGYGIEDEMCVNYIYYYPASPIEVCKSAVDNATLHEYFHTRHSIPSSSPLPIHSKFSRIDWSVEGSAQSLEELYSTAPLNMHCLQHDGTPFPLHPLNWTSVPQPRPLAGPFIKKRDSLECPAIND